MLQAPVSVAKFKAGTPYNVTHARGTDRIGTPVQVKTTSSVGGTIMELPITPALTARMAQLASAYQKIHYRKLHFTIFPQFATATAGGYCVGFLRGGAEQLPTTNPVSHLITNAGAKLQSWWNPTTMNFNNLGTYYTDKPADGGDTKRSYIPGKLYIVCDTPPTQDGYVTVQLDWDVTFSLPTLKDIQSTISIEMPEQVLAYSGTAPSGELLPVAATLWHNAPGGPTAILMDDLRQWNPTLVFDETFVFKLPFTVIATGSTSTTGFAIPCQYAMFDSAGTDLLLRLAAYNHESGHVEIPRAGTWTHSATSPQLTNTQPQIMSAYYKSVDRSECVHLVTDRGAPLTWDAYAYVIRDASPPVF